MRYTCATARACLFPSFRRSHMVHGDGNMSIWVRLQIATPAIPWFLHGLHCVIGDEVGCSHEQLYCRVAHLSGRVSIA